jgi:hypothetical protein
VLIGGSYRLGIVGSVCQDVWSAVWATASGFQEWWLDNASDNLATRTIAQLAWNGATCRV